MGKKKGVGIRNRPDCEFGSRPTPADDFNPRVTRSDDAHLGTIRGSSMGKGGRDENS